MKWMESVYPSGIKRGVGCSFSLFLKVCCVSFYYCYKLVLWSVCIVYDNRLNLLLPPCSEFVVLFRIKSIPATVSVFCVGGGNGSGGRRKPGNSVRVGICLLWRNQSRDRLLPRCFNQSDKVTLSPHLCRHFTY